jgi:endonuclease G
MSVSAKASHEEATVQDVADIREDQTRAAAKRFKGRAAERHRNIALTQEPGGLAKADTPERVAKRLARLSSYHGADRTGAAAPKVPLAQVEEVFAAVLASDPEAAEPEAAANAREMAGVVLEKVINTPDFVDIRYLEAGSAAARAVCRVDIRDRSGHVVGFGTGSLVSPRLLLTNHHVLPDRSVAARSVVEFNFQDGIDGRPLQPQQFDLDPNSFFVADEAHDFALVAVFAPADALAAFGFNRLIGAEGKAIVGEFVTIVQHPKGQKKQVALRENRIVDVVDSFLHYEADTEPGSSGSPVFNDQWEVVALHHASVPATDHAELGGIMNEGIRISRVLKAIHDSKLAPNARSLADQIASPERIAVPAAAATAATSNGSLSSQGGSVRVAIPLEVTLSLGGAPAAVPAAPATPEAPVPVADESIKIDKDYSDRRGYDPDFLGAGEASVPLAKLSAALEANAAVNSKATGEPRFVLPYHHYSVVLNKDRRLAYFTAVNIDGASGQRLKREPDRWIFDPRVPTEQQTGEDVYTDNPLDRGHLVRRLDPAWGADSKVAKLANDDTFHFTNCTPQHKDFNENKTSWAGLEDYVLDNAQNRDFKVNVFSGPVFASDDDDYRGVKLPRQFWKVVTMVKEPGVLSATGYLLSQASLIAGLESAEAFSYGAYKTFQVPVTRVEELTGLDFGALRDADPLGKLEATVTGREVGGPRDLLL